MGFSPCLQRSNLNHFNYFSEIESAFVRRRGKNLLLSPVDWALIESWEKEGIPLRIVLSTIDELFDQLEADPKRAGSIRTLSYCKDAVEARYRTWKESMVGSPGEGSPPDAEGGVSGDGSTAAVRLESIAASLGELEHSFGGEVGKAVAAAKASVEKMRSSEEDPDESVLDMLDESIDAALYRAADEDDLRRLRESALWELGQRASLMESEALESTIEMLVKKELRRDAGIPALGMFRL